MGKSQSLSSAFLSTFFSPWLQKLPSIVVEGYRYKISFLSMVQAIDQAAVNTIRVLAGDMTHLRGSGHPGKLCYQ